MGKTSKTSGWGTNGRQECTMLKAIRCEGVWESTVGRRLGIGGEHVVEMKEKGDHYVAL